MPVRTSDFTLEFLNETVLVDRIYHVQYTVVLETVFHQLCEVVYREKDSATITYLAATRPDHNNLLRRMYTGLQWDFQSFVNFTGQQLIEEVDLLDLPLYAGYPVLTPRYRELLQELTL